MSGPGRVGPVVRMLGFAGLLPQVAVFAMALTERNSGYSWLGFAYASLILSFLGGIWWSVAVRRSTGQATLVAASVTPSLLPLPLLFWGMSSLDFTWPLVAVGVAIMLTLLVDRSLEQNDEVPPGWMRLRILLSLGLGLLSIMIAVVEG